MPPCGSPSSTGTTPRRPANDRRAPPIEREPCALRPPHDVPNRRWEHLHGSDNDAWRAAVRLDRVLAMREPLEGLEVTEYEHRTLEWLAGWETSTVAVIAGLLHRARAAEPLPDGGTPHA